MKLLYFAWLRTRIGTGEEDVELPDGVGDVAALIAWLKSRGDQFAEALKDDDILRVAINQEMADATSAITNADEVALFPPMTGG